MRNRGRSAGRVRTAIRSARVCFSTVSKPTVGGRGGAITVAAAFGAAAHATSSSLARRRTAKSGTISSSETRNSRTETAEAMPGRLWPHDRAEDVELDHHGRGARPAAPAAHDVDIGEDRGEHGDHADHDVELDHHPHLRQDHVAHALPPIGAVELRRLDQRFVEIEQPGEEQDDAERAPRAR